MATEKERDFLAECILPSLEMNASRLGPLKITGFLSMKGDLYNNELMVVGRAVNGWTQGIYPTELNSSSSREEYAETIYRTVTRQDGCPMEWITECWGNQEDYNTRKSAFWRVIRTVIGELNIADIDQNTWPSHIVWSNLYKLAPEEGGNPNNTLCNAQLSGCCSLLKLELSIYNPKRLLLLTGIGWAKPFLNEIFSIRKTDGTYVEAVGKPKIGDQPMNVVVATHPQGKPENEWVHEVLEGFQE